MRHATTFWAAVCLCVLLGPGCGPDGVALPAGERQAAITDGTPHSGHPSVGFMVVGTSTSCAGTLSGALCTVTLVGKRTVLTAAHCIDPGQTHIVCFGAATYQPQKMVVHPSWNSQTLANDIAVLILSQEPGITPSEISLVPPSPGTKITMVGFGSTAEEAKDAGIKRIATNTIKDVYATRFSYAGTGGGIGNSCHGDSGGPIYATVSGREMEVGVTSAGVEPCGVLGYATRTDAYQTWLQQESGGDLYVPTNDTEKPKVAISAPTNGATLTANPVNVTATATDNVGVTQVSLLVDGVSKGSLTAPPYTFSVALADGARVLRVVARDAAGNQGEAQVAVTVSTGSDPPPDNLGLFGAKCDSHATCESGLCGNLEGDLFCTQSCDPTANPCPQDAECLPADGDSYLCGPPVGGALDGEGTLVGGCAVGPWTRPDHLGLPLLGLALLWLATRRRRR